MSNILAYPNYLRNPQNRTDPNTGEKINSFLPMIHFTFTQRVSDTQQDDTGQIFLYMPLSAKNPMNVQWEQKGLGLLGNIANTAFSGNTVDALKAQATQLASQDMSDTAKDFGEAFLSSLGDAGELAARQIANPHVKMLFRGIGMRTFEYTFKFAPKTPEDSRTIDAIITRFRQAAAPGRSAKNYYLTYPEQIEIQYESSVEGRDARPIPWMNRFKSCVITALDVDYTSAGHYVPMRDGFPSETTLTMQFTETAIVTRGMIGDQGY